MAHRHVRTLVLPVAGLAKRLRPLTLNKPKALVEIRGGTLLDHVLDEARGTSIRRIILIASPRHRAHFEQWLRAERRRYPEFKFFVRYQEYPAGNGHAILQAYDLVRKEPIAVRFCDDILPDRPSPLSSLLSLYDRFRGSVVLLERVPRKRVSHYGVVKAAPVRGIKDLCGAVYRISDIVEKPPISRAPSRLTIVGGYVFTPTVIRNLKKIADSLPSAGADALPVAIGLQVEFILGNPVYGWEFSGKRLDCGTLAGLEIAERFLNRQSGKRSH